MMRIGRFDVFCIIAVFIFFLHTVLIQQNKSLQKGLSGSFNATKYIQIPCEVKTNVTLPIMYLILGKE